VRPDTPAAVHNVLTVDVEEYYHAVEVARATGPRGPESLPSRVVAQTEHLLDLLGRHGARATFFTLGSIAERHPRLVAEIVARGHEIASHGWDHRPVYALGATGFRADVRRARRAIEQAAGRPVWGYRAPVYSLRRDMRWALAILQEEGHRYDSSLHPIAHDRYGAPDAPRFPHVVYRGSRAALWEVPVGTARLLGTNLPAGGGFFRFFPAPLIAAAIASVNRRERRPFVLYVHPWEFDPDQPRLPMGWAHRARHYVGLRGATAKLRHLLERFRFTSIADALENGLGPAPPPLARAAAS
jgi:polysaccharide deacetylase family protein (PEP-CTERM system associated)